MRSEPRLAAKAFLVAALLLHHVAGHRSTLATSYGDCIGGASTNALLQRNFQSDIHSAATPHKTAEAAGDNAHEEQLESIEADLVGPPAGAGNEAHDIIGANISAPPLPIDGFDTSMKQIISILGIGKSAADLSDLVVGLLTLGCCTKLVIVWFCLQNVTCDEASPRSMSLASAVVAALPCFCDGVNFSIASGVLLRLDPTCHWNPLWLISVVGSFQIGQIVSAWTSALMMDNLGRQRALQIVALGQVVAFGVFVAFPHSAWALIIGRFIGGVFFGQSVAAVYVSERVPVETRGLGISCVEVFTNFGSLVGIAALAILRDYSLRFMWQLCCLGALVSAAAVSTLRPDDPADGCNASRVSVQVSMAAETPSHRRGLHIACALGFLQQAAGEESLYGFSMHIARDTGLARPVRFSLLLGTLTLLTNLISSTVVDGIGRRPLLISGMVCMSVAWATAAGLMAAGSGALGVLAAMLAYELFFGLSLGPGYLVVATEVLSDRHRASGVATSLLVSRLASCGTVLAFVLQRRYLNLTCAFAGYSILMGAGATFVHWSVPETAGKSFEEIQTLLAE